MDTTSNPLTSSSADLSVKQVVAILEEDIVLGYLHPRERLVEDDMCTRFNITRHAVRQALTELEKMGLVERRKNVGAFVRSYSDTEVVHLYVVREVLETSAARQIVLPVPAERLEGLIKVQLEYDQATRNGDVRSAFRANIAFHQTLFALTDNPILTEAIDDFARRAHLVRFLSMGNAEFLQKARDEHWQIIEALRNERRELLVTLCRSHLEPSRDAYLEQYRQRYSFST